MDGLKVLPGGATGCRQEAMSYQDQGRGFGEVTRIHWAACGENDPSIKEETGRG